MSQEKGGIIYPTGSYGGEVLDHILQLTAHENDTYKKGLIHIETGIVSELTLPTSEIGDLVQDNVPTPDLKTAEIGENGFNEYKITERKLVPRPFMIFKKWNPETMASYWKPFQPKGNQLFRDLSPQVQADFVFKVLDEKNRWLGQAIWQSVEGGAAKSQSQTPEGATKLGAGSYKYFDGVIERLITSLKDTERVNKAILAGNTTLDTGEAVESAFQAMFLRLPDNMRADITDLTFVTSWTTWLKYDQYLTSQGYKYKDNSQLNELRFKGIRVIPVSGVPEHTIVLGKMSTTQSSNLWMGIDWASPKDEDVFKIGSIAEYSVEKFIQMRMKADVNVVKPCEIIFHTAYATDAAPEAGSGE